MRLQYIALGAGAGGAWVAWQGGAMLASSKPYRTTLGATGVIIAVICFSIAAYFWRQYRKKRSQAIRDINTPAEAKPHAEHEQ
jgi:H+/gluconate symporter-like permease